MERTFSTWRGTTRGTEIEARAPAPRRVLVIATPGRKDAATDLAGRLPFRPSAWARSTPLLDDRFLELFKGMRCRFDPKRR
jgi:hypothetical protein